MVMTPHGKGVVVAETDPHYAYVSINGAVRRVPRADIKRIPVDKSNFPSLLQSEENKRRAALNEQLKNKLETLAEIPDDAVFSKELLKLAEETKCQQ
jgi:hypothetical protein